jgi:hypothetical protein
MYTSPLPASGAVPFVAIFKTLLTSKILYLKQSHSKGEENGLKVFEKCVIKRIFGPKSSRIKLFHNVYSSPVIIRVIK